MKSSRQKTQQKENLSFQETSASSDISAKALSKFWPLALCLFLIVVVGIAVYWNSFKGIFIFDDEPDIIDNIKIHSLAWPWEFLWANRRPFLFLTFALNFALGKFEPFGYHLVNLIIHIFAALCLFGIVRLSCTLPKTKDSLKRDSLGIASIVSLIWLVHPLQTQSVTYVAQRAESLMGLLYLLSLLCSILFFIHKSAKWLILASLSSLLGGLTKEVAQMLLNRWALI